MMMRTAVVVGLCAHGLTLTRSLSRAGCRVVALEANRTLPGLKTVSARIIFVEDINGPGLVSSLISLAPDLSAAGAPVLLLTNDTMVETVAKTYEQLSKHYRISWADCATRILPLLRKEDVHRRCIDIGMLHPRSVLIRPGHDLVRRVDDLGFPIIFKPDRPVSSYKTLICEDALQLQAQRKIIERSLPAIAQEFIPGTDSVIHFAALYLDRGKILARYEGRKLRSRPMGHTTIAIGEANDQTHRIAKRFFSGLELSGPVSLEVKADTSGQLWVIEPTVGRTDFWVGLCVNDGIDLPVIEYFHATDRPCTIVDQHDQTLWINEERDPAAILWLLLHYPRLLLTKQKKWVYLSREDLRPFNIWLGRYAKNLPIRLGKKLMRSWPSAPPERA